MMMIFMKKTQGKVMKTKRNGQGNPGRLPGEVAQGETGRLLSSQPCRQLGEEHFHLPLNCTRPTCWVKQCFPFAQ